MSGKGSDVSERLKAVIPENGIRAFHRDMTKKKVPGSSYAMIHRYLSGKKVPSLEFLDGAADVLGVRPAWLICGDGERTEPTPVGPTLLELTQDAAYQLVTFAEDKQAVIDAFHGAVRRLYWALETEPEPEQLSRMAELLVRLVREPLLRLRHNFLSPREVQDHYVAMLADEPAGTITVHQVGEIGRIRDIYVDPKVVVS